VEERVRPLAGTEAGRSELSVGAGGDRTVELDRAAEEVVLEALEKAAAAGERFSVLSEEAGLVRHGADFPLVLVDPVDGSLNAKLGVPLFGLMLALAEGPVLGRVSAGYVRNLATGQSWHAIAGRGAWQDGLPLRPIPRWTSNRIRILGLETSPRTVLSAQALMGATGKVRLLGSMAISIALTASGALDVFYSGIPARSFDMAASLLLLREVGGAASDLQGRSLDRLPVTLKSRTTLICSADPPTQTRAVALLAGA
jgi:myo-inositol-1(or 4)-monophosphatase